MQEYLITKKNQVEFKNSLVKVLNTNVELVDSKLNIELLESYIKFIYQNNEIDYLDPFVIKLSKHKELFSKYLSKNINITYNEYLDTISKIILDKKNYDIIKKYAINNLELFDFENEIEVEIAKIYASHILKNEIKYTSELKWLATYLILKEANHHNIIPSVKFVKTNLGKYIIVKKKYTKYLELELAQKYNTTIYINLTMYNILKKKNFNEFLIKLLNDLFYQLQKVIEVVKENNIIYNIDLYNLTKETIIYKEKKDKYALLSNNPLINNFGFKKLLLNEKEKQISSYDIEEYFDSILLNNPIIIKKYPLLNMEYNEDGYKKNLRELLDIKITKIEYFNNQIREYNKILSETENEIVIDNIKTKLEELEKGIKDINIFHDTIIYKSLNIFSILDLTKLLSKMNNKQITTLKEAVIYEKNNIIKKIENNRMKIFKTSTFLKKEEILTKEYSKVASYESKINDYQKENGLI